MSAAHDSVPYRRPDVADDEVVARARAAYERLRTRRSVREFSDRPVPREAIEAAILAAGTAPNGANQQPWTFVAVADPDLKHEIRRAAENVRVPRIEKRRLEEIAVFHDADPVRRPEPWRGGGPARGASGRPLTFSDPARILSLGARSDPPPGSKSDDARPAPGRLGRVERVAQPVERSLLPSCFPHSILQRCIHSHPAWSSAHLFSDESFADVRRR